MTVRLDDGAVVLETVTDGSQDRDRAAARCNLLAGVDENNGSVAQETGLGASFGLARVSVASTVPERSVFQNASSTGQARPPATTAWHDRLAWVLVIRPERASSCPAQRTTPSPAAGAPLRPVRYGYDVLLLDATTLQDGLVYSGGGYANCSAALTHPSTAPLLEQVSVPWTLGEHSADGRSATLTYQARGCDSHQSSLVIDTGTTSASVRIGRPVAECGREGKNTAVLHGETVRTPLPDQVTHGLVGAVDVAR